jgi:hypothetical protein
VTIEVSANVVAGNEDGGQRFYVTMSTSAKNPDGGDIPTTVIQDVEFTDDLTDVIKDRLVKMFRAILGVNAAGADLYFSSSSSSSTLISSQTSGKSESSSSSRLEGTSSSLSSVSSVSSVSSLSSNT